jgi:uncharacterized glyoxalase superfamily protein PhnB
MGKPCLGAAAVPRSRSADLVAVNRQSVGGCPHGVDAGVADATATAQSRSPYRDRQSRRCDDWCMPQLNVIGVIVSDLQTAINFYQRLGLQFPRDPDPEGHGHVETTLAGGLRFTLDTEESIRSFDPHWSPPSGGHRMAVAFLCESPTDVDRVYRELVDAGAEGHKEPWDAFWGQRYAQVNDPDGNVVDLFASLEV